MNHIFIDNIISGNIPLKYIINYSKISINFGIIEHDKVLDNDFNSYINEIVNKFYNNIIKLQPKKIITRYINSHNSHNIQITFDIISYDYIVIIILSIDEDKKLYYSTIPFDNVDSQNIILKKQTMLISNKQNDIILYTPGIINMLIIYY
jgi:hypothetical protein